MPAPLKIVADAFDGLVHLALDGARRGRQRRCLWHRRRWRSRSSGVAHHKSVHAPQKSLNAFHARILPVEIAVGRRGEQTVEARRVGSIARDHLIGRDHVAQALRHLGAVFDHHALREQALDRLVVGDHAQVAHEASSRSASRSDAKLRVRRRRCTGRSRVRQTSTARSSRRRVRGRCARRCSDRNTTTNRRTCPWYRFRGAPGRHTWGKSRSRTPARGSAAIRR